MLPKCIAVDLFEDEIYLVTPAERGAARRDTAKRAPVDLAKLLTREISLVGTYRFIDEFAEAVRQIVADEVDLRPMISADMALDDPAAVFARALDKTETLKVMVHF